MSCTGSSGPHFPYVPLLLLAKFLIILLETTQIFAFAWPLISQNRVFQWLSDTLHFTLLFSHPPNTNIFQPPLTLLLSTNLVIIHTFIPSLSLSIPDEYFCIMYVVVCITCSGKMFLGVN